MTKKTTGTIYFIEAVGNYLRGMLGRKVVRRGIGDRPFKRHDGRTITTNPMVYSIKRSGCR